MEVTRICYWLELSVKRLLILKSFAQPLTATHVARRTSISRDSCLHHLWSLTQRKILRCLNPDTRFNRLYTLTDLGKTCRRRVNGFSRGDPLTYHEPEIPWDTYSSVCYRHRAAVLESIRGDPVQAAAIKRTASIRDPALRMSANNVRDVMKYLLGVQIVRRVVARKKVHPRYELTELGRQFQRLLLSVRAL
jgi:DNA-binding HxlR family transcriptional regulator